MKHQLADFLTSDTGMWDEFWGESWKEKRKSTGCSTVSATQASIFFQTRGRAHSDQNTIKRWEQLVTTGSESCSMRKDCIKWTFHYTKGSLNEGKTNKTTSHQALAKIPGDKRQKSSPQNSTDVVLTDWLHFLKCRRHTSKNVKKRNKSFKNEKGILSHTNGKSAHLRTARE